jgi:E3 ubiquitin-protein ligase MYCBP2
LPCVNKYIDSEFINQGGNLKCLNPTCGVEIEQDQIKGIIGLEKFEVLEAKVLRKMCNFIGCCKCKAEFEFVEGNAKDAPKKDPQNNPIKPEHAKDYAINRFICPTSSCKTEQCRSCEASPYHLGMTCKEYKDRALLK